MHISVGLHIWNEKKNKQQTAKKKRLIDRAFKLKTHNNDDDNSNNKHSKSHNKIEY